jgi:hypothetical protein
VRPYGERPRKSGRHETLYLGPEGAGQKGRMKHRWRVCVRRAARFEIAEELPDRFSLTHIHMCCLACCGCDPGFLIERGQMEIQRLPDPENWRSVFKWFRDASYLGFKNLPKTKPT